MTLILTDCLLTTTPFEPLIDDLNLVHFDDDVSMTVRVKDMDQIDGDCPIIEKQSADEVDDTKLSLKETMDHHGECLSDDTLNGMTSYDSPSIFCGPSLPDSECLSIRIHTVSPTEPMC